MTTKDELEKEKERARDEGERRSKGEFKDKDLLCRRISEQEKSHANLQSTVWYTFSSEHLIIICLY